MALDLWGREIVKEPPKKKVRRKEPQPIRRPAYVNANTDIVGWFRDNKPETFSDIADLRKAMKTKKPVGNYSAVSYQTRTGRTFLRVYGPTSDVMIVSRKARALFNKHLRNREYYLDVLREQFGPKN